MRICPSCNAEVPEGDSFCHACGTPVAHAPLNENANEPEQNPPAELIAPTAPGAAPIIPAEIAVPITPPPAEPFVPAAEPVVQDVQTGYYTHRGGGFLLSALLCAGLLPLLLNALLLVTTKTLLPQVVPLLTQGFSAVLAFGLFSDAVLLARGKKFSPVGMAGTCAALFTGGGGALVALLLFTAAKLYLAPVFAPFRADNPLIALLIIAIAAALESLVVAFFAARAIGRGGLLSGFVSVLLGGLLLLAARYLAPALCAVPATLGWTAPSLPAQAAQLIATALLQWLVLQPLLVRLVRGNAEAEERPLNKMSAAVIGALVLALSVVTLLPGLFQTPGVQIDRQIDNLIDRGDRYIAEGDLFSAAASYKTAIARRDAWGVVLLGQGSLWGAVQQMPHTDISRLLLTVQDKTEDRELYPLLLTQDCPTEFYAYYLQYAKEAVKSDKQLAARQRDIVMLCLLKGIYSGQAVTQASFTPSQAKRQLNALENFDEELDIRRGAVVYSDLAANGGVLTLAMAESAVALAEKYPKSIYLQGMAMELGAAYTNDLFGNCYAGAIVAAQRFDALYKKEYPKATAEEQMTAKATVAIALMKCRALPEAKKLLTDAMQAIDMPQLKLLYASCLYRMNELEECAEIAESFGNSHPEALGLAMLARGVLGETEQSLRHARALSAAAQTDADILKADYMLYAYAQGLAGTALGDKHFPQRYARLGEEDLALLAEDALLESTVQACVLWQEKSYAQALAAADKALSLAEGRPNLYFLRGAILFEQNEYEAALADFLTTLSLDRVNPTAWFMLGHCYDRLQRYEESAAAFDRVLAYIPNSDHALDYYGIALHAERAVAELQSYMGTGKENQP